MQLKSRVLALPLAAILASGALLSATPAEARTKSKDYKTGAIALGALGAYLIAKGKTGVGAAVLGGGVLAYNKSEQLRKRERNGYYNPRYNSNYRYNPTNNGSYGNGNSGYYNGNNDYRYDNAPANNYRSNDNEGDSDEGEHEGRGHHSHGRGHHFGHSEDR